MELRHFIFCTRHGMFDVRHYMIIGGFVMATLLMLVSQTSLQARTIDPALRLASLSSPVLTSSFRLKTFGKARQAQEAENITRLASVRAQDMALPFSPKERKACSIEAARAAANGDPSKVSSCIDALFSGDPDSLATLPEKMGSFFIETMNSDIPGDQKANIFINSMMQMMERLSGDGAKKTATSP